jgi:hypothetical protein
MKTQRALNYKLLSPKLKQLVDSFAEDCELNLDYFVWVDNLVGHYKFEMDSYEGEELKECKAQLKQMRALKKHADIIYKN